MYICHLKKQVRYSGKKDTCWKSSHNHVTKYMLKTFLYPIEWPASALFFLFEINNKSCFYWAGFYKRILLSVSLSSFETTETFFFSSLSFSRSFKYIWVCIGHKQHEAFRLSILLVSLRLRGDVGWVRAWLSSVLVASLGCEMVLQLVKGSLGTPNALLSRVCG